MSMGEFTNRTKIGFGSWLVGGLFANNCVFPIVDKTNYYIITDLSCLTVSKLYPTFSLPESKPYGCECLCCDGRFLLLLFILVPLYDTGPSWGLACTVQQLSRYVSVGLTTPKACADGG